MKVARAFTLVELLVAIAIIAILAGLLLPALARAKSRAKAVICLGNLRQWGMATHLFATENSDFLPMDGSSNGTSTNSGWYIDLPRALGLPTYQQMPWRTNASIDPGRSLWICPSNPRRSNGNNLFHYCLNEHVNGTGKFNQQIQMESINNSTRVIWMFDNGGAAAVAQQNNVHSNLHSRGAQFLFLDGHAARFKGTDYWDYKKNKGCTNNPDLVWIP